MLGQPTGLIHGDLHPYNVKWLDGALTVFDFDDCGVASPALELSTAAFYLRSEGLEPALFEGYASQAPLPDHTPEQFEALIAARNILLLSDLVDVRTADERAFAPEYLRRTVRRLRHWLNTGTYVFDVPS